MCGEGGIAASWALISVLASSCLFPFYAYLFCLLSLSLYHFVLLLLLLLRVSCVKLLIIHIILHIIICINTLNQGNKTVIIVFASPGSELNFFFLFFSHTSYLPSTSP